MATWQCPVFPIHWVICCDPSQYQNWPPQIDFPKGFYTSLNKLSNARFKIETSSSEKLRCNFNFVFPVMADKVRLLSTALIRLQPLPGKAIYLPPQQRLALAENQFALASLCITPISRSRHFEIESEAPVGRNPEVKVNNNDLDYQPRAATAI